MPATTAAKGTKKEKIYPITVATLWLSFAASSKYLSHFGHLVAPWELLNRNACSIHCLNLCGQQEVWLRIFGKTSYCFLFRCRILDNIS